MFIDTTKPITFDRFNLTEFHNVEYPAEKQRPDVTSPCDHDFVQMCLIPYLEYLRQEYVRTHKARYYLELLRWMPQSFEG